MLLRDKVAKHERFRVILYTLLSCAAGLEHSWCVFCIPRWRPVSALFQTILHTVHYSLMRFIPLLL